MNENFSLDDAIDISSPATRVPNLLPKLPFNHIAIIGEAPGRDGADRVGQHPRRDPPGGRGGQNGLGYFRPQFQGSDHAGLEDRALRGHQ